MKKFLLPFVLCLIPFVYCIYIFPMLPEIIPIHFGISGKADDWGSKNYIFACAALPLFIWILFVLIRKLDPKDRLKEMGSKYDNFLVINILLMSILSCVILDAMAHTNLRFGPNLIMAIVGASFILIGNYMPSFKPNYFMGIRTPWTLESAEVWKKTHKLGGIMYILTGLFILCLVPLERELMFQLMLAAIFTSSLTAIAYSYWYYQKLKKEGTL